MQPFTHADLLALAESVGHDLHESPLVVVLRNEEDPGAWNDYIVGVKPDSFMAVQGTADPGKSVMLHQGTGRWKTHSQGASRIVYGYYPDLWYPSYHHYKTEHPCWRQLYAVPIERYQLEEEEWKSWGENIGSYNLHRAMFNGHARTVGNYGHGCIVVLDRIDHWNLLLYLGYPEHGPKTEADKNLRRSLLMTRLQHHT